MRRILVQFARAQAATKRGDQAMRVSLSEADGMHTNKDADLISLGDALIKLEELDPRQVRSSAFALEARDYGFGSHSGFDHFQRHFAPDRLRLFG